VHAPWVPITHATPLAVPVSHLSRRCHLRSAHDGLFDVPRSSISDVMIWSLQFDAFTLFVKENYSIHISVIIGMRSFKRTLKHDGKANECERI